MKVTENKIFEPSTPQKLKDEYLQLSSRVMSSDLAHLTEAQIESRIQTLKTHALVIYYQKKREEKAKRRKYLINNLLRAPQILRT